MAVGVNPFPTRTTCKYGPTNMCQTGHKNRPLIISKLMWMPFDERFDDILKNIDYHIFIIHQEFQVVKYEYEAIERANASEERRIALKHRRLEEQDMLSKCGGSSHMWRLVPSCRASTHSNMFRSDYYSHRDMAAAARFQDKFLRKLVRHAKRIPPSGFSGSQDLENGRIYSETSKGLRDREIYYGL